MIEPVELKITTDDMNRYFQVITKANEELTVEDALKIQEKSGYAPEGYGFYSFRCDIKNAICVSRWNCSKSCD
tara:strand:+ start:640 stop:858 length:219 start_codon:yes stop_codon:yes gene_type:complete